MTLEQIRIRERDLTRRENRLNSVAADLLATLEALQDLHETQARLYERAAVHARDLARLAREHGSAP